eukprot:2950946-Heterocapsa_arctica.AAC.1
MSPVVDDPDVHNAVAVEALLQSAQRGDGELLAVELPGVHLAHDQDLPLHCLLLQGLLNEVRVAGRRGVVDAGATLDVRVEIREGIQLTR